MIGADADAPPASKGWRISLRRAVVVGCLVLTAYAGIVEGRSSLRSAVTSGQRIASVTALLYGVAAAAALIAHLSKLRWTFALLLVWGAALTITGAMGPVVWGEAGVGAGAAGGLAVAGLVALVLLLWRMDALAPANAAD